MTRVVLRSILFPLTGAALLAGTLTACDPYGHPNETIGTLGGAAVGGFIGSQFGGDPAWTAAATGLGVLVGAALGNHAGQALDEQDRDRMQRAKMRAYDAPVGETITWSNPRNGHQGSFTPLMEGYTNTGRYCRQYRTTVTINGRLEEATGTACKAPDGTWEIVHAQG